MAAKDVTFKSLYETEILRSRFKRRTNFAEKRWENLRKYMQYFIPATMRLFVYSKNYRATYSFLNR